MKFILCLILALLLTPPAVADVQTVLLGFQKAVPFNEQIRWTRLDSGIRVFIDAPLERKAARRLLVLYATPNGSTIEQTLGCAPAKDQDWRFDIQHIAAQI